MNVDQLASVPGTLKIDGVGSDGRAVSLTIPVCKSLPAAVGVALNRDLINIGKGELTPYHRVQKQLKAMAAMARQAADERDTETANQIAADRTTVLNKMTEDIQSGRADDLAIESYYIHGRQSVAGLLREITTRAKHAGTDVNLQELATIVTPGNASLVMASLQVALGEIDCPTEAT